MVLRPQPKSVSKIPQRGWVLTVYSEDFPDFSALKCDYTIAGREWTKEGKIHQQCYIYREAKLSFTQIKKVFPTATHIQDARCSAEINTMYCSKGVQSHEEWEQRKHRGPTYGLNKLVQVTGECPHQGSRNDLTAVYAMCADGCTAHEIAQEHPSAYLKYFKAIEHAIEMYARQNNSFGHVKVYVIWGDPGVGKSAMARSLDPDLYKLPKWDTSQKLWFDGYMGQRTLLLEEFEGQLAETTLMELLDGYKFNVPTKGSFVWKRWHNVILTSNLHPRFWYGGSLSPRLNRRIKQIKNLTTPFKIPADQIAPEEPDDFEIPE